MGLPNLFPFKEQVLKSLARKKEQKESEAKLKKLKNKEKVNLQSAAERSSRFENDFTQNRKNSSDQETMNKDGSHKEKRKYMKELRKVMEASDVLFSFN